MSRWGSDAWISKCTTRFAMIPPLARLSASHATSEPLPTGMLARMDTQTTDAVAWLLQCDEPAVRHLTRRDLLDESSDVDRAQVAAGPAVTALLSGQQEDGGFGDDPYRKWTGAHWRLVALAELEAPADDPRVAATAELVLE